MTSENRPVALVTGGSRGIGAATALTLARGGYDVALTYRNKQSRADAVAEEIRSLGREALSAPCDITHSDDVTQLMERLRAWRGRLDLLVLNASGGMERELVAANPDYPMLINRDAQIDLVERALPLMEAARGGVIVFVTSHWAYLYGQMTQLPAYEPIAASKYAGEQALRQRMASLAEQGIRLIVVTGDLIDGTITPKLLERTAPGLIADRQSALGKLPTAEEMGAAIASAAMDPSLQSGALVVIGESLESMLGR